jgi:hypothetical protein
MTVAVMETVQTDISDFYQARWLGEAGEAPLIYPEAIVATRALGGLRRLWLKIDATPQEYLAWEEVMDHWLLPRSRDYGEITCYTSALERFDQTTTAWWRRLRYDMRIKGQSPPNTWEEVKRLARQRFVPADCLVERVSPATTAIVPYADTKADVVKDVVEAAEPLNGLNMQLKRFNDDACMAVERGQRWSLF